MKGNVTQLKLYYHCINCNWDCKSITINVTDDINNIIRDIADNIVCNYCGKPSCKIHSITIKDNDTEYDLPLDP